MILSHTAREIFAKIFEENCINNEEAERLLQQFIEGEQLKIAQNTEDKKILIVLAAFTCHVETVVPAVLQNPLARNGYFEEIREAIRNFQIPHERILEEIKSIKSEICLQQQEA